MWIIRSIQTGLMHEKPADFPLRRRKAFSILIFTLVYNVFMGVLLFLGEDLFGSLLILIPSGSLLAVLIMLELGRLRHADIEKAASPYINYTASVKNSFEHISDMIKENGGHNSN